MGAAAVLAAYRLSGVELVRGLRGDFGVVVVDVAHNQLVLASDAFRTRPLWLARGATAPRGWHLLRQSRRAHALSAAAEPSR